MHEEFLRRFARLADADDVKEAARRSLGRTFGTRREAEASLRDALEGLARRDAVRFASTILSALGHAELKAWASEWVTPRPATKDEAIDVVLDHYFPLASEREEGGEEVEEVEDLAQVGDEGLRLELRAGLPVEPRPHQVAAIRAFAEARRPGLRHQAVLPTGGGKTLVGTEAAVKELQAGGRVLWVAMDWHLLWQAARDAARRHDLFRLGRLGRVGGARTFLRVLPEDRGDLRYSTVQTVGRRDLAGCLRRFRPTLVVWDECHLGQGGKLGARLKSALARLAVPVLGLTATPREVGQDGFRTLVGRVSFEQLVRDGVLARPVLAPGVPTGARVDVRLDAFGDLSAATLDELARDEARNRVIVDHWCQNQARYGRSLIFACRVDHANELLRRLQRAGIAARVVHSQQRPSDNQVALKQFREGSIDVLIGVAMLTHGIDVPDARTVVLTRPTTSDILYAQMIGRGARRTPTKAEFHIVEFTDNCQHFHGTVYSARDYFDGAGGNGVSSPDVARSPTPAGSHRFDPRGLPLWVPAAHPDPALRGLWLREGQTFGLEVELTHPRYANDMSDRTWRQLAEPLREALAVTLGEPVEVEPRYSGVEGGRKDYTRWCVERDGSVGWEVTTPVLEGVAGYEAVARACRALETSAERHGFRVDATTGLHLHLGWREGGELTPARLEHVRRLLRLMAFFEPALATLVAPSRVADFDGGRYRASSPNRYTRPVSTVFPRAELARCRSWDDLARLCSSHDARYVTLNPRPMWTAGTVEVRMHSGTVDAGKALLWTSLCQQLLWAAEQDAPIPDAPDRAVIEPSGDIVDLARRFLPSAQQPAQQALLERLARRRSEVVARWRRHSDLGGWLRFADPWEAR